MPARYLCDVCNVDISLDERFQIVIIKDESNILRIDKPFLGNRNLEMVCRECVEAMDALFRSRGKDEEE